MGRNDYIGAGQFATPGKGKASQHDGIEKDSSSSAQIIGDAGNVSQVKAISRPTKTQVIKKHIGRFWVCYGIGGIVLLAIGLPILFLVIVPKIAQRLVDDADLPIYSVTIRNPKANSVVITLATSLKIPKGLTVHLDPLTLQLYRPEEPTFIPFVEVSLPGYKLRGTTNITLENQLVTIGDIDQFTKFLGNAVANQKFVIAARGKARAHLGALHADVTLDKKVTLDGLDNLKGFSIDSATAVFPPEADGTNLRARLTIPNRSTVSFDLGNETLNINGPNGLILGNATVLDVYVQPGNNTFEATGVLDLATLVGNLQTLITYWAPSLANGNIKLAASGNATIFNGEHIKYYEDILNGLELEGEVPVISLLANSLGNLLGGGMDGIKNLTDYLGLNVTEILGEFDSNLNTSTTSVRSRADPVMRTVDMG
ncbi:hypothetical protein EJ05DRAFT_466828 [Pseudovirgaria hyperparasitica]|uniref:Uncharacterized protein n=1 Tax=Pseudovirgaria hyperparasitica TaxID=470096 RepID=A0A6A6W4I8_9PEZI|nr:uncharacterized protein EJ05DRAFT_466828 [Pseudovirgaria hyperparasitica]KAF2756477.1 hypothetical protein EJ05DRAFT_466828 [Pseudovirgaria hyperparasitica]